MSRRQEIAAWVLVAVTFVALMGSTWIGHSDAGDAQVYRVVARHLVEDGQWLHLRYLPAVHTPFYEHLPFPFWLMAGVIRVAGDGALELVFGAFSLGVLLLTGALARRLAGPGAALVAMLVLATTMHFFKDAGHPLLDPLLLLLTTASALPVLLGRVAAREWVFAGVLAALAAAVKGPFGLVPLAAASFARAVSDRSWRVLFVGAAVTLAAAAPVSLFLATHRDWWVGYGEAQLLASATGARTDGTFAVFFPFRAIVGRFWPGLPLAVFGASVALGWPRQWAQRRSAALLAWTSLAILVALCLPARKVWHHTLIAYPFLAALGGVAVGPWLDARLTTPARIRVGLGALAAVMLGALVASAAGIHRLYLHPPCVVSDGLAAPLSSLPAKTPILVVSSGDEWDLMSALAAERDLTPEPTPVLPAKTEVRTALVKASSWEAPHPGWSEVARAQGWVLARAQ